MQQYTLQMLSERFNLEIGNCVDPRKIVIRHLGTLQKAGEGDITFLENPTYRKYLPETKASAVILSRENAEHAKMPVLISNNPYLIYAKIAGLFNHRKLPALGIHPTAVIGDNCNIHESVRIGAHCVIGDNCYVGPDTCLYPNVTLYDGVKIGARVIIHSGAVIGSDGFGNAREGAKWFKVPQLGGVIIGDDAEIGSNTTIDRGSLEDTVIEEGVRLDNLIQVAHNVVIGAHTAIAGCAAIAGSVKIGKHCMIGGGAAISGHIEIGDGVIIGGMSGIMKSIKEPGVYMGGFPSQSATAWRKMHVRLRHLDELFMRVERLEKKTKGDE